MNYVVYIYTYHLLEERKNRRWSHKKYTLLDLIILSSKIFIGICTYILFVIILLIELQTEIIC
jgi:hypothetical protein